MVEIKPSEITPEPVYINRRAFLKGMGILTAGALALAACGNKDFPTATPDLGSGGEDFIKAGTDEFGNPFTSFDAITNYNNYYEFSLRKQDVARLSKELVTSPWTVSVGGLVKNPRTFDVDDLIARFTQQERIYRLRCVEAWSMVVPWLGFSLGELLDEVQPMPEAKFVRFETLFDPEQMPGQKNKSFNWPYIEGLRLDEAVNDLAILATGIYGKPLTPQNGAPIRLVVPWKYGFKSLKSIVKIDLVAEMPVSLWMASAPHEYGFYANVNPEVDHPRWSQTTERRIGESDRRPTLMFNGYADEVAYLYEGMDYQENFLIGPI